MRKLLLAFFLSLISWGAFAASQEGGYSFNIVVTPTVTAGAYSSGQAIGGLQSVKFFKNNSQPSGILNNISISSKGGATTAITLYIFSTKPSASTCTDNSAFVLGASDISKQIASSPLLFTPAVVGTGTTATYASNQLPVATANGDNPFTTLLYVCPVVGGTVTPASTTDLIFNYGGLQD